MLRKTPKPTVWVGDVIVRYVEIGRLDIDPYEGDNAVSSFVWLSVREGSKYNSHQDYYLRCLEAINILAKTCPKSQHTHQ